MYNYIVYSEVTNQSMSRREFLLLLIKEMSGESLAASTPALPSTSTATSEASRESQKESNASYTTADTNRL